MIHYGLIIVGLVILVVYSCKIIYRYHMYDIAIINTNSSMDYIPLDDVNFHVGDVLLFRFDCSICTKSEYVNMIITSDPWPSVFSHIGVVTKIRDDWFIAHKTFCEDMDSRGNCKHTKSGLYPLKKYIREYRGNVYISSVNRSLNIDPQRILEYNDRKFVVDPTTVFDYILGTDILNRKNVTMSCSSYVYNILRDADVLSSDINGNHTTPMSVYQNIMKSGKYEYPKLILNDYITLK